MVLVPPRGAARPGHPRPVSLHVVLVHPEIPWNAGNVGRTCLLAGARLHLVRPLGFALDDRSVRRAGLDYWEHVDKVVWPGWESFAAALPSLGVPYLFSAREGRDICSVPFGPRPVLIFGRESEGLPVEIRAAFPERLLQIPMAFAGGFGERAAGAGGSLNLSSAVAVAVYEVARQHRAA